MPERELSLEELAALARARGLDWPPERLAAVLPEVRALLALQARLPDLPDGEAP